jgi:SAM-dependent methyltransferase
MVQISSSADHVAKVYGDGYFEGGGAGYRDYLSEAGILIAQGRRYGRLVASYGGVGRLLDVGAAAGCVLKGYFETGWRGQGIEPNPKMSEYARTQLGVPVATGCLESFRASEPFDLISMIQVLGHFVNPRKALENACSMTRPGGFWLVETWNRESLTARLFGKRWHEYSPPSVLHWFSPKGVSQLAAEFGFREVARGRPTKWITAGHAKSLVGYKVGPHLKPFVASVSRLVPDSLNVPYPAEDLFWMILQKN